MTPHEIRVLHVEDDVIQQRLIRHHLQSLPEFAFKVLAVESEDLAMAAFQQQQFDLIILDYQLAQGDGLHLLNRMRQLSPFIPIIAISGVATREVAADLVTAGADDYFNKSDLDSAKLAKSIRAVLLRTATISKRTHGTSGPLRDIEQHLLDLCQSFVARVGAEPFEKLNALESELRNSNIRADEIELVFNRIHFQVVAQNLMSPAITHVALRLLCLDLFFRLECNARNNPDSEAFAGL
jgi:CheY-like chemotaxis protein